ncbi:hypothetical protein [Desulfomarina sp.]
MMEKKMVESEIETFLSDWGGEGDQPMKNWFRLFFDTVKTMEDVELQFVARPGVSFSIRPKHRRQTDRELFAIIDVIDDDPAERWLSVCFYGDMITDPEERGEVIPRGLSGSDGYCFDMFEDDKQLAAYLVARLKEAGTAAGK